MKILQVIIVSAITLFSTGCAYNLNVGSKEAAAKGIKYNYDKFEKTAWLTTEVYQSGTDEPITQYYLRAHYTANSTAPDYIQIYGQMFSQIGWCFLDSAFDDTGYSYKFNKVDKSVDSGVYAGQVMIQEHFALTLPLERLESFAQKDYELKASGKKCDSLFKVDQRVSAAFLDAIKKRRL